MNAMDNYRRVVLPLHSSYHSFKPIDGFFDSIICISTTLHLLTRRKILKLLMSKFRNNIFYLRNRWSTWKTKTVILLKQDFFINVNQQFLLSSTTIAIQCIRRYAKFSEQTNCIKEIILTILKCHKKFLCYLSLCQALIKAFGYRAILFESETDILCPLSIYAFAIDKVIKRANQAFNRISHKTAKTIDQRSGIAEMRE